MRRCPYCHGSIDDTARKCVHCGEWISKQPEEEQSGTVYAEPSLPRDEPAAPRTGSLGRFFAGRNLDETLNEGVKTYVKFRIVMAVVGLIVFLIFLFAVWLPGWNKVNNDHFPGQPVPVIRLK